MKVKIVNLDNAAGLKDPITRLSPFLDADGKVVAEANVPDNTFWRRRLRDGDIALIDDRIERVDSAPTPPLTTRGGK